MSLLDNKSKIFPTAKDEDVLALMELYLEMNMSFYDIVRELRQEFHLNLPEGIRAGGNALAYIRSAFYHGSTHFNGNVEAIERKAQELYSANESLIAPRQTFVAPPFGKKW